MCNRQTNVNQLVPGHTLVFAADTVSHAQVFSGQVASGQNFSGHTQAFSGRSPVQLTFALSSRPRFGIRRSLKRSTALGLSSLSPGIPGISL